MLKTTRMTLSPGNQLFHIHELPSLSGTINTLVVTNEAARIQYEDQKSIVMTFLKENEVDAASKNNALCNCVINEARIRSHDAIRRASRSAIAEIIRSIDLFASFTGTSRIPAISWAVAPKEVRTNETI